MMRLSPHVRRRQSRLVTIVLLAGAVALCAGFVVRREAVTPEQQIGYRPVQAPRDGYASSASCRACHPSQYASWHRSYHRTMTQLASPDAVVAGRDRVIVAEVPGRPMVLERRGNQLWAEFDDPDWTGGRGVSGPGSDGDPDPGPTAVSPPRIQRRVVMTTGSHNQQIHWYATGQSRVLGQLPAIQLVAERRWIPRYAAVMRPPDRSVYSETGAWNGVCVSCHTTDGRTAFDTPFGSQPIRSQKADTTSAEFGIACEACHGPSGAHVRANVTPQRRYWFHLTGRPDPTIVQPLRLNPRRSSQVCAQCHSFWEFPDSASERRANVHGLPYRPGDDITATRFIVQPTTNLDAPAMKAFLADDPGFVRDIFWADGMVRATGREYNGLIESPCYKNATDDRRMLTCFSCHTMHATASDLRPIDQWADDQLAPQAIGDDACVQCHAIAALDGRRARPTAATGTPASVEAHTHHRADSSGSSCYNCHMPYTTYGLLKTIRSHQIGSPSVKATLDTGRPNACNLCHLDKTLAWTADAISVWYGTPKPALPDEAQTVAASLVDLLKGDAGQRAIVAQSMGWAPAQQTSGTAWMAPWLALLLDDSYDAVRFIASRSLRSLPAFASFGFDFVAPPRTRAAMRVRALEIWRDTRARTSRGTDPTLLFKADGTFNAQVVDRLIRERNTRRVVYRE
jgi:hypothetical protein